MESKMEFHIILCFMRYPSFELFHPFKKCKNHSSHRLYQNKKQVGSADLPISLLLSSYTHILTAWFGLHGPIMMPLLQSL